MSLARAWSSSRSDRLMSSGSLYNSGGRFEPAGEANWPPEIAFLASAGVDARRLDHAARQAKDQGVGGDEILIAEGMVEEDFYYAALARRLNCPYVNPRPRSRPASTIARPCAPASPSPIRRVENFDWLMAPRGAQVRKLLALGAGEGQRIAICAPKIFSALVRAKGRRALSDDASFALSRADSRLSANAPQLRWSNLASLLISLVVMTGLAALSPALLAVASLFLSALFLGGVRRSRAARRLPAGAPRHRQRRRGFLPYFFAIGYATLFDVIDPGLAALGLPLPLGVHPAPDRQLGRLERHGRRRRRPAHRPFRPPRRPDQLHDLRGRADAVRQLDGPGSRWMKGGMQTLSVFLRTPRRHWRTIGAGQYVAALCMMSSLLAGPLFGPFYGLRLARDLIGGDLLAPQNVERLALASVNLGVALFGTLAFVLLALHAMRRRGLRASPLLLLTPLYLALQTVAAWLALWQWTRKPFVWNKTAHHARPKRGNQAGTAATNLPASASAINARVLSTP